MNKTGVEANFLGRDFNISSANNYSKWNYKREESAFGQPKKKVL